MVRNEYFEEYGTEDDPIYVDVISIDNLDRSFAVQANHVHGRNDECLKNRFINPRDCKVTKSED